MFNVTEAAQTQVAEYFKENAKKPVRVFLHPGSCSGPQVAMALDEKKDSDEVYDFGGVEYIVEKSFLAEAQPIEVDYTGMGFKISTSLKLSGGGCSGCGSSSSCCS